MDSKEILASWNEQHFPQNRNFCGGKANLILKGHYVAKIIFGNSLMRTSFYLLK